MNALKKTLFIIAMVSASAYTIRHAYYLWFQPRDSVLDKYAEKIADDIKNAASLDQLLAMYDAAHQNVKAYEADKTHASVPPHQRGDVEPYRTREKLEGAIRDWEYKTRETFQLRFFWAVGLVLTAGGYLLYKKSNAWLGLATIIVGFTEQIYWSSPTFLGGAVVEYEVLLANKFALSLATVAILIIAAFLTETLIGSRNQGAG